MQQSPIVEEARAVFTEGKQWSILRWLAEKRRVRRLADEATRALAILRKRAESGWSDELKSAYADLAIPESTDPFAQAERDFLRASAGRIPAEVRVLAETIKRADDIALGATLRAEDTFAEAERWLSADLSRRGAQEAIESYDLRYQAIAIAEVAGSRTIHQPHAAS